ncbi:hypothetical protein BEWA_027980 [Theileria equi strain WA]|uniref:tRNA (guanine(9)-N(1))-methyltransferase n=1 Tax=Theileria equi strain WA TaxID=1537102 RepID=L0AYJ4_THEEQ|nr:hypothetical protein BEWA_027980 [Theileria equi strain WA]AFZ79949.1 hypothetical protein BEWA_027980 [Theileria equi strain WA]|eukprot:XP_004829615.1 hypothetical protein BEWA_027980 [Theileria equi strain WA]
MEDANGEGKHTNRLDKKDLFINLCKGNATIVIDCEFEQYASEKEAKSLANQIMQSYGANKRADKPFNLIICGIEEGGHLDDALGRISGTENWLCQLTYESIESLLDKEGPCEEGKESICGRELTYLSADATDVLESVDSNNVYVIGGIVDRNRLNGITYNKAKHLGYSCKRLPIKEHIKLNSSHVLSVTACINILLHFYKNNDWKLALQESIPKRKLLDS